MRAIIDTNVFIAGLLWRGSPHVLLEHARAGTLAVISSSTLIAELADVLGRAKFAAILSKTSTSLERTIAEVSNSRNSSIRRHWNARSAMILPMTTSSRFPFPQMPTWS